MADQKRTTILLSLNLFFKMMDEAVKKIGLPLPVIHGIFEIAGLDDNRYSSRKIPRR